MATELMFLANYKTKALVVWMISSPIGKDYAQRCLAKGFTEVSAEEHKRLTQEWKL